MEVAESLAAFPERGSYPKELLALGSPVPGARRWEMQIDSACLQFESRNFKLHGKGKRDRGKGACCKNYCDAGPL